MLSLVADCLETPVWGRRTGLLAHSLRMWFKCGDISSPRTIWVEEPLAGADSAGYADFAVVTETVTNTRYLDHRCR